MHVNMQFLRSYSEFLRTRRDLWHNKIQDGSVEHTVTYNNAKKIQLKFWHNLIMCAEWHNDILGGCGFWEVSQGYIIQASRRQIPKIQSVLLTIFNIGRVHTQIPNSAIAALIDILAWSWAISGHNGDCLMIRLAIRNISSMLKRLFSNWPT